MMIFLETLHHAYAHFQEQFGERLLGVIEIGSFAHDEAVSCSDHDLRLIIHSDTPLFVLNEHAWTEPPTDTTTPIQWQELNHQHTLSFGLTNLAYIERLLRVQRFPLVDHTCLYQGRMVRDDTGAIAAFRTQYASTRFANIVPDYVRQTGWRVTTKLARERQKLAEQLDDQKYAVPALHTCYRVVCDLAQIASYQMHGTYISNRSAIEAYYRARWPWFEPTFQALRSYKTNEVCRKATFMDIVQQVPERLYQLEGYIDATIRLWEQYVIHYYSVSSEC